MTLYLGNQKVEIAEIEIPVDGITTGFNNINQLISKATYNSENNTILKLWIGDSHEISTKSSDTLYFFTDLKQIYHGDDLIANNFINTSVLIDNKTIKRISNKLQAQAIVNQQNTNNIIKVWAGNKSTYESIETPSIDTLYFIRDDNSIYLGNILISTGNVEQNNLLRIKDWVGTQAEYNVLTSIDPNTFYYITDTKLIYYGEELITKNEDTRNIGEIVSSIIPLIDDGLHLLDGSLLQYGIYKEFIDYIENIFSTYPQCFCTETEWQSTVTTYGSCGKFVYDSSNKTVRLPKIEGFVESCTDLNVIGDLIKQFVRLPNITGSIWTGSAGLWGSGAFENAGGSTPVLGGEERNVNTVNFKASNSSSIYSGDGTNTKVQPQSIKVLYYIVIGNSTKTSIEVDINNIITDLSNKMDRDLINSSNSGKILISEMGMPSNKYIDLILNATGSTYNSPANGYFSISKTATAEQYISLTNRTSADLNIECRQVRSGEICRVFIPAKKNDVVQLDYDAGGTLHHFRFIYAVGSESEAN